MENPVNLSEDSGSNVSTKYSQQSSDENIHN
jgi:hypothetical protein